MESIKKILKKYEPLTLAKSIYTIVSWLNNRNYLYISDNLNRTYLTVENELRDNGLRILNYDEFCAFFYEVVPVINGNDMCESFPVDIGEVVFYANGKYYKTIIGNGSEDIYEAMFFMDDITTHDDNIREIWEEILIYEHNLLNNLYSKKYERKGVFECPPFEYFNSVFDHFEQFSNPKLQTFFQDFENNNVELYDLFSKKRSYPIFLPLMKEIFIEKIERDIDEESFRESKLNSIKKQLKSNYLSINENSNWFIDSLFLINKNTDAEIELDMSFVILAKQKAAIFFSEDLDESILNIFQSIIWRDYTIKGTNAAGKSIGMEFKNPKDILLLKISDCHLSPNISKFFALTSEEYYIDFSGLMGVINFSTSIDEIVDFFWFYVNKDKEQRVLNSSGLTSYFQIWQERNKVIVEGSQETFIIIPPYQSVTKTVDFFSNDLINYPYYAGVIYSNVHRWNVSNHGDFHLTLVSKNMHMSSDILKFGKKSILYSEHVGIVEDIDKEEIIVTSHFNDIILFALNEFIEEILYLSKNQYLDINIVSKSFFDRYSQADTIIKSKYCQKIIIKTVEEKEVILIIPYWNKICNDSISSRNRLFENELLLSILEGIKFNDFEALVRSVKQTDNEPKTSFIKSLEVPYYVNPIPKFAAPVPSAFKNVRKILSKIVVTTGLEPKVYEEHEIPGIIRRFRNQIRDSLVKKIVMFDYNILIQKLLNVYSTLIFETDLHQKRLDLFGSKQHLHEKKRTLFREEAIELREISRTYRGIVEYLIEEIQVNKSQCKTAIPTQQEIDELIAYSKWINDFQTMSDSIYYGATNWDMLEIREDFVVEIAETEKQMEYIELLKKLKYEYGDYSNRDEKLDHQMFDKVKEAFELDTNISFDALILTLRVLYSNQNVLDFSNYEGVSVNSSIVEVPLDTVADRFIEDTKLPVEDFFKVISFILLDDSKIANQVGVIPVWEKKKRNCKLSAQPLLYHNGKILYSPISLYGLEKDWIMGILNFTLPYNVGLDATTEVIQMWKERYEKKIVDDLAVLFDNNEYVVYQDKELYKLDPKGSHPKNLGDFDLIVIDNQNLKVLLIEVKYMRMSQTVKDALGDQKEYFTGNKALAKKFKRRVEYFEENAGSILANIGFNDGFTIESYFVTNKNTRSVFEEYKFKVISFNEFKYNYVE